MPAHRIMILATPHVVPFNVITPLQVFERVPDQAYRVHVCSFRKGVVFDRAGLRIEAGHGLEALARADTILVPGFDDVGRAAPEAVLAALRQAHARGARIASICTGAFLLAQAGLLAGRRATTHWAHAERLGREHPAVEVDASVLYTHDGGILTAAGYTSGVDLCLHLIRLDHGQHVANQVARFLVASPHRSGGQAQFIERPIPPERSRRLDRTRHWLLSHLEQDIRVADMAAHAGLALRSFTRRFEAEAGMPPMQWLIEQRVRQAQTLLETTDLGVDLIAQRCGFGSALSLRQHFRRVAQVAPSAYRRTWQIGGQTA